MTPAPFAPFDVFRATAQPPSTFCTFCTFWSIRPVCPLSRLGGPAPVVDTPKGRATDRPSVGSHARLHDHVRRLYPRRYPAVVR